MFKGFRLATVVLVLASVSVFAGATKEEAQKMVEGALSFCKTHTKKECFAAIDDPTKFNKGELFIFAFDYNGVGLANGQIPKLIGKNMFEVKNADGVLVFQEQIKTAKSGGGWYEYKWLNPETKKQAIKVSYIKDVDGTFYIGCGIHK